MDNPHFMNYYMKIIFGGIPAAFTQHALMQI